MFGLMAAETMHPKALHVFKSVVMKYNECIIRSHEDAYNTT